MTAQASRILVASAVRGEISAEDKAYLAKLVASRAGLSQADAAKRVDSVLASMEDAKSKAKAVATATKASATFALVGALSMIVGAFIASVAAVLGVQAARRRRSALRSALTTTPGAWLSAVARNAGTSSKAIPN